MRCKPYFFDKPGKIEKHNFPSHRRDGSDLTPPVPLQIRKNPYSQELFGEYIWPVMETADEAFLL